MKTRRLVDHRHPVRRGGHPRLWGYGYQDLAALFGMHEGAVRMAVARGRFDPSDLMSVVQFTMRRSRGLGTDWTATVAMQNIRASEASRPHTLTVDDWHATLAHFGGRCAYCGQEAALIDHFVPICLGGGTTQDNSVPSCLECNARKAGHHPLVAARWLGIDLILSIAAYLGRSVDSLRAIPARESHVPRIDFGDEILVDLADAAGVAIGTVVNWFSAAEGKPPRARIDDPSTIRMLIEKSIGHRARRRTVHTPRVPPCPMCGASHVSAAMSRHEPIEFLCAAGHSWGKYCPAGCP